jgi:hypothetical protein
VGVVREIVAPIHCANWINRADWINRVILPMNKSVNKESQRFTVIPRSAAIPLAMRKSNSGAGDLLFFAAR